MVSIENPEQNVAFQKTRVKGSKDELALAIIDRTRIEVLFYSPLAQVVKRQKSRLE